MGYGFGILGCGLMCFDDFVGLGLWVWVHGSGFAGLRSWTIDVIGVDRRLDRYHQRGSLRGREREKLKKIKTKKNYIDIWYIVK